MSSALDASDSHRLWGKGAVGPQAQVNGVRYQRDAVGLRARANRVRYQHARVTLGVLAVREGDVICGDRRLWRAWLWA